MIIDMDGYSIDFDKWIVLAPNVPDMPIDLLEVNGVPTTKEPSFEGSVDIKTEWRPGSDSGMMARIYMTGRESAA